jgi:hypothetical protein
MKIIIEIDIDFDKDKEIKHVKLQPIAAAAGGYN